jgi:dipeptidyl-peptidase-3
LNGKPLGSWYGPGETWDAKFPGFGSSYEECRAECVGIYLCTNKEVLAIFGHGEGAAQPGADVMYVNWLNMARAGLLALQYYSPESKKWGQAHMQARYVILQVLLEAGEGLVEIASRDPGAVDSAASTEGHGTCVLLDRSKIETVGREAIGRFLTELQVIKSTADFERGKALYERLSAVDERFLQLRAEVVRRRKPRGMWVQANFSDFFGEEDVRIDMFPATVEGVIRSFARRFPTEDPELVALAEAEAPFHDRQQLQ